MKPVKRTDLNDLICSNHDDTLASIKQAMSGFESIDEFIADGFLACLTMALLQITTTRVSPEQRRNLLHDIVGNATALLVIDEHERGSSRIECETRARAERIAQLLEKLAQQRIATADA